MSQQGYSVAANVFGTLGAVCWSVQLFPQIWKNYRSKSTVGLQPTMMLLWALAGIPLGVYNIVRKFSIALQIQPQILTFLSLVTWAQCYFYTEGTNRKKRGWMWCVMVLVGLCVLFGGVEAGVTFAILADAKSRPPAQVQYWWPVVLVGVLAGFLLCAGVFRHYVDIYQERTVRGISFLFCGIDAMGDLTSLISVVLWYKAGESLDILGISVYASEFIMWTGVFICGAWFNLTPWLKERLQQKKAVEHIGTDTILPNDTSEDRVSLGSTSSRSSTVFRTASERYVEYSSRDGQPLSALRLRPLVPSQV